MNSRSSSLARPYNAGAGTFTFKASPSQPATALGGELEMAFNASLQRVLGIIAGHRISLTLWGRLFGTGMGQTARRKLAEGFGKHGNDLFGGFAADR
jgi:hypothetical protein